MRIAFATAFCGFIGLWVLRGYTPAATLSSMIPHGHLSVYPLLVLPLFIMMGYFAFYAGITNVEFPELGMSIQGLQRNIIHVNLYSGITKEIHWNVHYEGDAKEKINIISDVIIMQLGR